LESLKGVNSLVSDKRHDYLSSKNYLHKQYII
jgi:hypothetical protein